MKLLAAQRNKHQLGVTNAQQIHGLELDRVQHQLIVHIEQLLRAARLCQIHIAAGIVHHDRMRAARHRVISQNANIHLRRTANKVAAMMQEVIRALIHTVSANQPADHRCRLFCHTVQHICGHRQGAVIITYNRYSHICRLRNHGLRNYRLRNYRLRSSQRFRYRIGGLGRIRNIQRHSGLVWADTSSSAHTAVRAVVAKAGRIIIVAVRTFHQSHNRVLLKIKMFLYPRRTNYAAESSGALHSSCKLNHAQNDISQLERIPNMKQVFRWNLYSIDVSSIV